VVASKTILKHICIVVLTPCHMVAGYQHFGEVHFFHLQSRSEQNLSSDSLYRSRGEGDGPWMIGVFGTLPRLGVGLT
jgi:hypothetical protein